LRKASPIPKVKTSFSIVASSAEELSGCDSSAEVETRAEGEEMTLEQALEGFKAEFPGWWWKVGECRISCDADIAMDKYDVGSYGNHPDSDLIGYRTFDEGFSVDLRQPSSVVDALLHVMGKARIARREFRAGTEIAAAMEDDAKAYRAECVARWSAAADTAMKAEVGLKAKTRA
jgi:hypothetical protein